MTYQMHQPTPLEQRLVAKYRQSEQVTPEWWDRDCRVCLELRHNDLDTYFARTGRQSYSTKGGDRIITIPITAEEVHADHTDEEIILYLDRSSERELERAEWTRKFNRGTA